jgi:hypothetical protein
MHSSKGQMLRLGAALLTVAAWLLAAACADIEVAVNTGGTDGGRDLVGPGADSGGPGVDGIEPRPDTGGPRPDTWVRDTVGPRPDTTPKDVVEPPDAPFWPDVPPGQDLPPRPDVVEPPTCLDGTLDPAWGAGLLGLSTRAAEDDFAGSCGGAESKDLAFGWQVPFSDWFVLETAPADFDTVLYLLESCEGPEVACNNDVSAVDASSRIVGRFREGDRYVLVVDGNAGSRGNATLSIQPVECPAGDVGRGAELPQTFSTAVGTAAYGGACGGDAGPERSFRFTPSETGLWRISATAETTAMGFSPALYLERGPICGGPLLQCNGHDHGGIGMPAEVTRLLPAGEPVTLLVDSRQGAGSFVLAASKVGDSCPALAYEELPPEAELDIYDFGDTWTSSCGENADVEWGTFRPYADILVSMRDLEPGGGTHCMVDVTAGFPFSLALARGECVGEELRCVRSQSGGDGRPNASVALPKLGGRVLLAVSPTQPDWSGWFDSTVRIAVYCVAK